jgi:acyl-coenzyme A thioesterase PaaI-like protein
MDITQLPYNRLIGLEPLAKASGFQVSQPDGPQYTNHLGTVHAGALLALAEAGSGAFLARRFGGGDGLVPVVRRVDAKFRKPARGRLFVRHTVKHEDLERWSAELTLRSRVLAPVAVEVVDAAGVVVLSAVVEWFISRAS